jgi:hypothetical protein
MGHAMSFWKTLFGGAGAAAADKSAAPVEYKGFVITPAPYKDGDQYQTAGTIEKEIAGARKEHRFIRADRHASHEAAVSFTIDKARQIIELQGERIFD